MMYDFEKLLPEIFKIIKEAGDVLVSIRNDYDGTNDIEKNEDGYKSLQTTADRMSDEILAKGMKELFPTLPYVSEENIEEIKKQYSNSNLLSYTLADPLDGTSHWRAGRNTYAVLFSVIQEGEPVFGIIYRPAEETPSGYYAIEGKGAFKFLASPNNNQQISVKHTVLKHGLNIDFEAAYFDKQLVFDACQEFTINNVEQVRTNIEKGYTELGAKSQCLVAEGKLDLVTFLMNNCAAGKHDIAASSLLVKEAGGYFTDLYGKSIYFDEPWRKVEPYICYSNPEIFHLFTKNLFNKYIYKNRVFQNKPVAV